MGLITKISYIKNDIAGPVVYSRDKIKKRRRQQKFRKKLLTID